MKWRRKVDVHAILNAARAEYDASGGGVAEERDIVVKAGKAIADAIRPLTPVSPDFEELADRFAEDVFSFDAIDYVLVDLYDTADAYSVWLGMP